MNFVTSSADLELTHSHGAVAKTAYGNVSTPKVLATMNVLSCVSGIVLHYQFKSQADWAVNPMLATHTHMRFPRIAGDDGSGNNIYAVRPTASHTA